MIHKYNVSKIIFIGVAGSLNESLNIGDIIIGNELYQHDLDASPIFPQFQLPIFNETSITTDPAITKETKEVIDSILPNLSPWKEAPKCYIADIATGDMVISSHEQKSSIKTKLPTAFCVEMEGAAFVFIAKENNIPFVIIRAISDDSKDVNSFFPFLTKVWHDNSKRIIEKLLM